MATEQTVVIIGIVGLGLFVALVNILNIFDLMFIPHLGKWQRWSYIYEALCNMDIVDDDGTLVIAEETEVFEGFDSTNRGDYKETIVKVKLTTSECLTFHPADLARRIYKLNAKATSKYHKVHFFKRRGVVNTTQLLEPEGSYHTYEEINIIRTGPKDFRACKVIVGQPRYGCTTFSTSI